MGMVINLLKNKKIKALIKAMGIFLIPIAFYFIPAEVFDNNKSVCIFKNIFNSECLGCGTTRATYWIMHFEFAKAYNLNKIIIIVFPLLLLCWLKILYKTVKDTSHNN